MPRWTKPIDVDLAQRLLADGLDWDEIGEQVGVTGDTVRRRLDPEYAQKRRDTIYRSRADGATNGTHPRPPNLDEAVLATIVPDTRTWHEKFMGDPIPSRSSAGRRVAR